VKQDRSYTKFRSILSQDLDRTRHRNMSGDEQSLTITGVSPKFCTALKMLVQAHFEELDSVAARADCNGVRKDDSNKQSQFQEMISEGYTRNQAVEVLDSQDPYSCPLALPDEPEAPDNLYPSHDNYNSSPAEDAELPHFAGSSSLATAAGCIGRGSLGSTVSTVSKADRPGRRLSRRQSTKVGEDHKMFGGASAVFASGADIDEQDYAVSQYYSESGCCQALARNETFDHCTLALIMVNALYMGVDSDYNQAASLNKADLVFIICENIFAFYFTMELAVRFGALRHKRNCFKDNWFKFDSALLGIIWFETWLIPLLVVCFHVEIDNFPVGPLRLLRLLRLARMVRIMRAFPELMTMIKGMLVATRAVGSAMLLLVIAIYAWAIAMHSFMKDDPDLYMYWGTVTRCMMTLMAQGTLGDSVGTVLRGVARNPPALASLIAFIVFSMLTVLNMLVGVLCEVVTEVAKAEKESIALHKLKGTLLVMLKHIDLDGSGDISKEEILLLLQDPAAEGILSDMKIDRGHISDIVEMHYDGIESLHISEIMCLLIESQGERGATVADMCTSNTFLRWSMKKEFAVLQEVVLAQHRQQQLANGSPTDAHTSIKRLVGNMNNQNGLCDQPRHCSPGTNRSMVQQLTL